MNRSSDSGVQCTIGFHVDDLKITCVDENTIDEVIAFLQDRFGAITSKKGLKHSYLGMTFDYHLEKGVKITQHGMVMELITKTGTTGTAKTPAGPDLHEIRDDRTVNPLLLEQERKVFHSVVQSALYLCKRSRPDIQTPVIFLTSRVQAATKDDQKKLDRVLRYLNGTRELGIILEPGADLKVEAYVDASHAIHQDYRSQTGCVITLGRGPIFTKATRQKLNTKSSTESELVGLSDSASQVIWTRDFLIGQGYDIGPAKLYQDNQSTIALVNKGRSTSERTRHIKIRHYWIHDRIQDGEVTVEYKPTGEMVADIMTKPLQGELFRKMRRELLNWHD
jgi:hypothetical protein